MVRSRKLDVDDLAHVGPGTIAGRYLRLFWQPLYRAADLQPGQVKPVTMLGEPFTLYRGHGGVYQLTAFRCAHRGAQLSIGWVEADCLRCRYHGWKYDATGQCVEQPGEEPGFAAKVRLRTYPTREYVGLIFAYLGDGEPPPFPRYPDLDRPGVIVTDPPEYFPCSFWNRLDNDSAHTAWVHRSTATRMNQPEFLQQRRDAVVQETAYGYTVRREPASASPQHFFMPNVLEFWARTRARGYERRQDLVDTKFTWTVPVDDDHFVAFDVTLTLLEGEEGRAYAAQRAREQESEAEVRWDIAEQILAGELTIEEIPEELSYYNGFIIEDYVTQVGQGSLADRPRERLGRNDARVIMNRKLWLRELTALAEGRPLADWKIPAQPFALGGGPSAAPSR